MNRFSSPRDSYLNWRDDLPLSLSALIACSFTAVFIAHLATWSAAEPVYIILLFLGGLLPGIFALIGVTLGSSKQISQIFGLSSAPLLALHFIFSLAELRWAASLTVPILVASLSTLIILNAEIYFRARRRWGISPKTIHRESASSGISSLHLTYGNEVILCCSAGGNILGIVGPTHFVHPRLVKQGASLHFLEQFAPVDRPAIAKITSDLSSGKAAPPLCARLHEASAFDVGGVDRIAIVRLQPDRQPSVSPPGTRWVASLLPYTHWDASVPMNMRSSAPCTESITKHPGSAIPREHKLLTGCEDTKSEVVRDIFFKRV